MATSLALASDERSRPLLLLHPVGLDQTFWRPVAAALESEHAVRTLDLPGHGEAPLGAGDWTMARYAAVVADFIAGSCDGPVTVIGLSFGGMIGQELALARPDLVRCLVLCGCTATFPEAAKPVIRERGQLAAREGMGAVVETTLERWFTADFLARGGGHAVRRRLETMHVDGWVAAWNAIALHDAQPRLKDLAMPVLCVAGERDVAATPEAVQAMADAIAGGRLEILERAPHMMQIETPTELAGLLTAKLSAISQ